MINIALVSYINTRPFMDGFEKCITDREIKFHLMPPSECAMHLKNGDCQMALIPVGALFNFSNMAIMPNYCIGADGDVASVFIFSQKPIEELDTIILDRHSRSSNGLAQILLRHHWKRQPRLIMATEKHFDQIEGNTGGVLIGDQAIRMRNDFAYAYDLAGEWKACTGLPFAFAVWAYDPAAFTPRQLQQLNDAMKWGVSHAQESAAKWADHYGIDPDFAQSYLKSYIDFKFDAPKHKALDLYYKSLLSLQQLELQAV